MVSRRQARERAAAGWSGDRRRLWPWLAGATVTVLLVGGATGGYLWDRLTCGGTPVVLRVVTSPDQFDVVKDLAESWERDRPAVQGRCARAEVRAEESATTARGLTPRLEQAPANSQIDVWMPDSSFWVTNAAQRPDVGDLLPDDRPSVATSPTVMALPRPMAQALGWPRRSVSWSTLARTRVEGRTWAQFGHPEWGPIDLGIGDPTRSTPALGTLLMVADVDANGQVDEVELRNTLLLARAVTITAATSTDFFVRLRTVTGRASGGLGDLGPFPATEQQVASYNRLGPTTPLVTVRPTEGTVFADYPFVALEAPWVDPARREAAALFRRHLRSADGRRAYGRAGFRDASRSSRYAEGLDPAFGMGTPAESGARDLPDREAITKTVVFWSALQRRANLLALVDTSGSMSQPAPDRSGTRMEVVREACQRAVALFSPESSVGVWRFSTRLDGDRDYEELVAFGPVGGVLPTGVRRREALGVAIQTRLRPGGNTGLYDSMLAAFTHIQARWQPGRLNLLVILTDGRNEDNGLTRAQLVQRLKEVAEPDKPVQVIAIGFGSGTDMAELTEITAAVGGRAYPAASGADIDRIFLSTLVGRG